jgi:hypothetical protein
MLRSSAPHAVCATNVRDKFAMQTCAMMLRIAVANFHYEFRLRIPDEKIAQ